MQTTPAEKTAPNDDAERRLHHAPADACEIT